MIHHFIDDFARNGRYTGFPALGIEWQKLESPTLQRALGMKPGQKGVLVRWVGVFPSLPVLLLISFLFCGSAFLAVNHSVRLPKRWYPGQRSTFGASESSMLWVN